MSVSSASCQTNGHLPIILLGSSESASSTAFEVATPIVSSLVISAISEATLTIFVSAGSPVSRILSFAFALAITAAAVVSFTPVISIVWLDLAGLDIFNLFVAVLFLAHDLQVFAFVLRLWVHFQEGLRQFFGLELNEGAAFEYFLIRSPQAHRIGGTILRKECLNVELCAGDLLTKSFGIDASRHRTILEDSDGTTVRTVVETLGQRLSPLDTGVVVGEFEKLGLAHGLDDGLEGLEMAHPLEGVQNFELDRVILAASDLGEEEFVIWEIGVGKVEFNLQKTSVNRLHEILSGGWAFVPVCESQLDHCSLLES